MQDASTYDKPYATEYNATAIPSATNLSGATNKFGASVFYEHETGVNEVELNGSTKCNTRLYTIGRF
jgi:hypothetical protein